LNGQILAKKVYRIIYRVEEKAKDVVVIRVFHIKRGAKFVKTVIGEIE